MIGARLGPYEVTGKLGEGGMGEVWRATDSRLRRDVAIKVLPAAFVEDRERLARFEREAQLLAQLNHSNIAQIYGMESSGDSHALVMELVEGPTLADRLESGSLPLDESLSIAREIVEALEEAHEKGIIHRDLKPHNIKASKEGKVKVLDFGLAKALGPSTGGGPSASQMAASPTMTLGATAQGVILGTAAYMSPEQARGLAVDKRADIWAFGVVLYEMLTGSAAFAAGTVPDTLAAVLTREIDWSLLPDSTPLAIRRLLRRCLERDTKQRLRDIADARLELDEPVDAPGLAATVRGSGRGLAAAAFIGVALVGFTLGAGYVQWSHSTKGVKGSARSAIRFLVPAPQGAKFHFTGRDAGPPALAPDGRQLVFAATDAEGVKRLYVRTLDRTDAAPLQGTEGAAYPFWAPDGRAIGFFADGKLKRVQSQGGLPQVLAEAPLGRGGDWNKSGEILFAPATESALFRVSAGGGVVAPVTKLEGDSRVTSHRWPRFLPDGRHFLYLRFNTVLGGPDAGHSVWIGSLDGETSRRLLRTDAKAEFAAPGHLLFTREGSLLAARFDPERFQMRGEPVPVVGKVQVYPNTASALFSVSHEGALIYGSGESPPISQLAWFDRSGSSLGAAGEPLDCEDPRLSPDGRRLAVNRIDPRTGASNIWLLELESAVWTRFTFATTFEHAAIWSPDGRHIAYDSFLAAPSDVYVRSVEGGGEKVVVGDGDAATPTDWSADGRLLLVQRLSAETGWDLWTAYPGAEEPPRPWLATSFNEQGGQLSPDGRWIAYSSDESGAEEVYVAEFPGPGGKWQVSSAGGAQPRWRSDGSELFYLGADRSLMVVPIASSVSFVAGKPTTLFATSARYTGYRAYDVTADGQRFLINTMIDSEGPPPLTMVLDWSAEVAR